MKSTKLFSFCLILFSFILIFSCSDEDGQGGIFDTIPTIKFELQGNAQVGISNAYFAFDGFGVYDVPIPWSTTYDGEDGDEWTWEVYEIDNDPNAIIIANQYLDGDLMSSDTAHGSNCHIYMKGNLLNYVVNTPAVIKLELKGNANIAINNAYFNFLGFGTYDIPVEWSSSFYGEVGEDWTWDIEEIDGDASAIIIANQYQNGALISTDTAYGAGCSINLSGSVQ